MILNIIKAPAGMSAKYMEIFNDEYLSGNEVKINKFKNFKF